MKNDQNLFNLANDILILSSNEFHIWLIDINLYKDKFEFLKTFIEENQLIKIYFIKDKKTKNLQIIRYGLLYYLLGKYLVKDPSQILMIYNKYGKPYLDKKINPNNLFFNISHSKNYLLIGLSRENEIGVDVELIRADIPFSKLISRFFSLNEQQHFDQLDESKQQETFFQVWTYKEAIIKALGYGIHMPMNSFTAIGNGDNNIVKIRDKQIFFSNLEVYGKTNLKIGYASFNNPIIKVKSMLKVD